MSTMSGTDKIYYLEVLRFKRIGLVSTKTGSIVNCLVLYLVLFLGGCINRDNAIPTEIEGQYIIQIKNQKLEIDPSIGGRIVSLKLKGENFLTDDNVNSFNWGSTFWISPQSDWDWPPSPELDNKPYSNELLGHTLKMKSEKDPKTGFVVTKEFKGNKISESFTIKYTISNQSDIPHSVAPWEVTRVHVDGIAFYPMGGGVRTGGLLPLVTEKNGIVWFSYDRDKLPTSGDRQLYSDGAEGWLAQINNGLILIKKFKDVPLAKKAPKEGEIELFASKLIHDTGYVEIENQGAYEILEPGNSLTWEVVWYLRELPPHIHVETGNDSLVNFVRRLVN